MGRCVPRVPQRADTRAHTQRGGIPTPRACPLLHLEPHQECGDLTRAGGMVPAPGPQAPRPPCCCLGGAGAALKGTGTLRGVWAPHAPWAPAQCGVQEGADTSTRAGSPALSLPSAGAGTHQNSETGRRKTSPEGGWCHRKPQPSGAEDRRRRFLPASALHALVHPLRGTSQHTALVHVLAACTDTSTHSWTCARVHARSPRPPARSACCCTPWPGRTLAHAAHTHPVMGTRTPSLPGRAALSPRPQFLFMVMEPPARPPLHQEGWPGWGAPPCPAAWPRCCPCALCWIPDPGAT